MGALTLVAEYDAALFSKLRNRMVIARVNRLGEAAGVYNSARNGNSVVCVSVHEAGPLSALTFDDSLRGAPIALHVPELGSLKKVFGSINALRESNITVMLPPHRRESFVHLRILSSLGVYCGLSLARNGTPNAWDAMNDLMHYAVYTKNNHAPIEPFDYVVSHYNPREPLRILTPLFDNPQQFIHMDKDENIALDQAKLEGRDFIAHGIDALDSVTELEKYQAHVRQWQKIFLDNARCAYCGAFRVCGGVFQSECEAQGDCYRFFGDLMEAADYTYAERSREKRWRL